MNFKIETLKWEWAEPVQSKSIYRDEEFVVTKTAEESLDAIDFLLEKRSGMTYTITVCRDDLYYTYFRHSMPCLGGLVKYRDSHGSDHYMNPYFPRDIRVAYPEGDTIYIGCCRSGLEEMLKNPYFEFVLSQESPWVSAFGDRDSILFRKNHFILTNMDTDPTVFYSLMRQGRFLYNTVLPNDCGPKAYILGSMHINADPRRLAGQKPIRISGGTWKEGFGYTRPYNESIFKTTLPHKLKDFGSVGRYPTAPFTNEYFVKTMKNQFGVDVKNSVDFNNKKVRDALTDSWDYFKEESKELDEG